MFPLPSPMRRLWQKRAMSGKMLKISFSASFRLPIMMWQRLRAILTEPVIIKQRIALSLCDIIICSLEEAQNNVFDIFPDISRFSQRGGIGNCERDVENCCQVFWQLMFCPNPWDRKWGHWIYWIRLALGSLFFARIRCSDCRRQRQWFFWRFPDRWCIRRAVFDFFGL